MSKTITVRGRTVTLVSYQMPDGSFYAAGRFARAVFSGEAATESEALAKAEGEARTFEATYTH